MGVSSVTLITSSVNSLGSRAVGVQHECHGFLDFGVVGNGRLSERVDSPAWVRHQEIVLDQIRF